MLSEKTIDLLKNFSAINPSIVLKPGKQIKVISNTKSIMASASIDNEIPSTAGIYDVPKFLATVSLFDEPQFAFNEKTITISDTNRNKVNYYLTDTSMIIQPPEKDIDMPECEVNLTLKKEHLEKVLRAAGILNVPYVSFTGRDDDIVLEAIDSKNSTSHTYSVTIGENTLNRNFNLVIKVENMKLINADYRVSISSKGLARFVNDSVSYWIAVESNLSNFGG